MEELIHEFEAVRTDRFHEAFGKFELPLTNEKTTLAAQAILDKHYEANFNAETLKKIHGFIDLTSDDGKTRAEKMPVLSISITHRKGGLQLFL